MKSMMAEPVTRAPKNTRGPAKRTLDLVLLKGDVRAARDGFRGSLPRRVPSHHARTVAFPSLPAKSVAHLEKSLKKQWKRYRKELKRCQDKFSERAIHDSRVQTRRLLSTVELLGGFIRPGCVAKIECRLKEHLDTFDDLRDTQVQLPLARKLARTYPAARVFRDYLVEREERFSKETRKRINKIKTGRLRRLIAAGREEVHERRKQYSARRAGTMLLGLVDRAFVRTAVLRARIDPRDPRTIHRTRVAFKKFRYMVEALADYLPGANDRTQAAMQQYQTMMGNVQDAEVMLAAFDGFLAKDTLAMGQARPLREELARRRQWLTKIYMHAAGQLGQFWPPPETPEAGVPATRGRTKK